MSDADESHGTRPVPGEQPSPTACCLPLGAAGAGRWRRPAGVRVLDPVLTPGPAGPLPYACDPAQLPGFEGAAP
jgi:hypothetical protein